MLNRTRLNERFKISYFEIVEEFSLDSWTISRPDVFEAFHSE